MPKCSICSNDATEELRISDSPKDTIGHLEPFCSECAENIKKQG